MSEKSYSQNSGASQKAISYHYDLCNEFYFLWLDKYKSYSCGLCEEGDTLEYMQERKLDYFLNCVDTANKNRVLDIGCGWGNALFRMINNFHVKHAVGITLSREQAKYIRQKNNPRIEVRVESWVNHKQSIPYNTIISLGAFEHFCKPGMSFEERVATYREFFERCHRWLVPGGMLGLQTVAKGNAPLDLQAIKDSYFIWRRIFPESDVPKLLEIASAIENLFDIVAFRNDRMHYYTTVKIWLERLRENRSQALKLVGEKNVERYERYFKICMRMFEKNFNTLYRFILKKD